VDVWTYFEQRKRELREHSLHLDDEIGPAFAAEAGTNDTRGRMLAPVYFDGFSHDTYLKVHEVVVVEGSGIRREKYAYFLVVNGHEIGGYERDPMHHGIEVHMHCSRGKEHERLDAEVVSFVWAAREAWTYVSDLARV
jgi:hypothetical protein